MLPRGKILSKPSTRAQPVPSSPKRVLENRTDSPTRRATLQTPHASAVSPGRCAIYVELFICRSSVPLPLPLHLPPNDKTSLAGKNRSQDERHPGPDSNHASDTNVPCREPLCFFPPHSSISHLLRQLQVPPGRKALRQPRDYILPPAELPPIENRAKWLHWISPKHRSPWRSRGVTSRWWDWSAIL
jgi:hypothetical protein